MRTHDRRHRYAMSKENEVATFEGELKYYRDHNTFPATLFSRHILNIYKHINVQVVVSKHCQFKCPFCIENDRITPVGAEGPRASFAVSMLDSVLEQYYDQGIHPHVSITGGEPTLFPTRLREYLRVSRRWFVGTININTNGGNGKFLKEKDCRGIKVNLSRHHYCETKVAEIFGKPAKVEYPIESGTTLQCVLMKGYIDSVAEMKRYMDFYIGMGAESFSFRGMSTLDADKQYEREVNFTNAHAVDFFGIANQVFADPDFHFIEQKIGDHYCFEFYSYKGKFVRLTYSNFDFLRKVETAERKEGLWFSRATVISPMGKVYAGWTYDVNEIL